MIAVNPQRRYFPTGSKPLDPLKVKNNFRHNALFGATIADLNALPAQGLSRTIKYLVDQDYTSWCTACNTSRASAYIEGIDMSFEYQAAMIGQLVGAPIMMGAEPHDAMKAMILYGSLPQSDATLTLKKDGDAIGDFRKWDAPLYLKAAQYEKASYFRADTGPFDKYDNIRVAMDKAEREAIAEAQRTGNPKKEYVVMVFSQWFAEFNGSIKQPDGSYILTKPPVDVDFVAPKPPFGGILGYIASFFSSLFGGEMWHAYLFVNWNLRDKTRMVMQNSYGAEFGDRGVQYWSRETVNSVLADPRAGAYIFRDIDPKDVKTYLEQQNSLKPIYEDILQRLRYKLGV